MVRCETLAIPPACIDTERRFIEAGTEITINAISETIIEASSDTIIHAGSEMIDTETTTDRETIIEAGTETITIHPTMPTTLL